MATGALVSLFYLAVWQLGALWIKQSVILPRPAAVFATLAELALLPRFWLSAGWSLVRVLSGYAVAIALGSLLGVLSYASGILRELVKPMMAIMRATPVASFIIILLFFLKVNQVPAFASFLMVLPVVFLSVLDGLSQTDPRLLEMAELFRISPWKKAVRIFLPATLPHAVTAALTSLGLAWKAGIAAEVLGSPAFSIGGALRDSKASLDSASLFAWTFVVVALSMLLEGSLRRALHFVGRRLGAVGLQAGQEGRMDSERIVGQ